VTDFTKRTAFNRAYKVVPTLDALASAGPTLFMVKSEVPFSWLQGHQALSLNPVSVYRSHKQKLITG
jgi:hypothetical protein